LLFDGFQSAETETIMKSILLSGTTALLLVAASGAFAQQDQHQNDNHAGQADDHSGQPADHPGGDANGPAGDHGNNGFDHGSNGPPNHTTTHTTTHHTTTHTTTTTNDNNHGNNGFNHNNNGNFNNPPNHNNNNNNGHNGRPHAQIDIHLKITVNATHHFHAPAYRAPRGYVYRRYNIGERLDPAFFAQDYWLTNYAAYDLIAPPDGYTWVRFGPDAILIDEETGETVQVQYGVFD
jgi:Ni/Co efflux regulator RcnB